MTKGLTLIEMLVAITIFAVTVGTISGLFISGIRSQRRVLATQEVLDQTSYVMEYMGRALRMAKKDDVGGVNCLSGTKVNYERTTTGNGGIRFRNHKDECQEFYLDGSRLKEIKGVTENYLTSSNLSVSSFRVNLAGEEQPPTDYRQPSVTISLDIESQRPTPGSPPKIQIQTSVSQRDLDVQY